jgi:glycosyltransferase involved in cell wall biosynthesis
MTTDPPVLSVIVPAHRGESLLPDTLRALTESDLPRERWELVVVDDASPDRTALVAARFADTVVRLSGKPHGPSYARNRGFEASRGDVLVFVDADVRVHPDALRRFLELFTADPGLGAAFGSYDDRPPAPGVVSRYRNLLHHYTHHQGAGEAGTFWAGLGAVRRDVFAEVDKFDEWHYERPQIEDIELGRRIRRAGHRIRLEPAIQGSHLKRWTLRDVLRTDLLHRGIPWMRLILREGAGGDLLNVKLKEKVCVALVGLALITLLAGLATRNAWALAAVPGLLAVIVVLNLPMFRYLSRGRGPFFFLAIVPLHLMYHFVSGLAAVFGHLHHWAGTKPRPSDRTLGRAERGEVCWPPVPVPPRTSLWRDDVP